MWQITGSQLEIRLSVYSKSSAFSDNIQVSIRADASSSCLILSLYLTLFAVYNLRSWHSITMNIYRCWNTSAYYGIKMYMYTVGQMVLMMKRILKCFQWKSSNMSPSDKIVYTYELWSKWLKYNSIFCWKYSIKSVWCSVVFTSQNSNILIFISLFYFPKLRIFIT